MVRYLLLDEKASSRDLSLLQALLDNRQKSSIEYRLMMMGREHAWVQRGHFYVIAMDGEFPTGFVFCVKKPNKIEVDAYYTHSKYRRKNVATHLTHYLIGLARSRGLKSVHISNALDSILNMARKMQAKPRVRVGVAQKGLPVPAEHFKIRDRSVQIFWPSRKSIQLMKRVQAHRRVH